MRVNRFQSGKETSRRAVEKKLKIAFAFVTNDQILNIYPASNEIQRPMFNVIHAHIISIYTKESLPTSQHITSHIIAYYFVSVCLRMACSADMCVRTFSYGECQFLFCILYSVYVYVYYATSPHTS